MHRAQQPSTLSDADGDGALQPRQSAAIRKREWKAEELGGTYLNRISVKFADESGVRPSRGTLSINDAKALGTPRHQELADVRAALSVLRDHAAVPVDTLPEPYLDAMRQYGEQRTGKALPNLSTWVYLYIDVDTRAEQAAVINLLNTFDIVEIAEPSAIAVSQGSPLSADRTAAWPSADTLQEGYTRPPSRWNLGVPPGMTEPNAEDEPKGPPGSRPPAFPPPSPDAYRHADNYGPNQIYWDPAPLGVDVEWLWANYNVNGSNASAAIVESAWNVDHDEFAFLQLRYADDEEPTLYVDDAWEHGTANVGIIGAWASDNHGIGGAVPDIDEIVLAPQCTGNPTTCSAPAAITRATAELPLGGVLLLELQSEGPNCNGTSGPSYVPIDYYETDRQRVIQAVSVGLVVVEGAGNGACSLDASVLGGVLEPSSPNFEDSGAIIVAAADPSTHVAVESSNWGSRIDAHAQGNDVFTTGYGNWYSAEGPNHYYTHTYKNTSSASAIVAAAAIHLQSISWNYHGSLLSSEEMRELFRRGGTPGVSPFIGNQPDLKLQVHHLHNRHARGSSTKIVNGIVPDYVSFNPAVGRWTAISPIGPFGLEAVAYGGLPGDIPVPGRYIAASHGRAQFAYFRPTTGEWMVYAGRGPLGSYVWNRYWFGQKGDIPMPMDYWLDGNDVLELAVYRQPTAGGGGSVPQWIISIPSIPIAKVVQFGDLTDQPLLGDFDNDGAVDLVVYNAFTGRWRIEEHPYNSPSSPLDEFTGFGNMSEIPLVCKYDGLTAAATYNTEDGRFRLRRPTYPHQILTSAPIGTVGDVPMCADTDGDGDSEFIVFRPDDAGAAGLGPGWYNDTYGWFWPQYGSVYDHGLAH